MQKYLSRRWIAAGSAAGLLGVAMAAYAAHAPLDPAARGIVHSAVEMQLWHALALVAVGIWTLIDFIMAVTGKMKDKEGNQITNW